MSSRRPWGARWSRYVVVAHAAAHVAKRLRHIEGSFEACHTATKLNHPPQMNSSDALSFSAAAGPEQKGFFSKITRPLRVIAKPVASIVKPIANIVKPFVPILGPVSTAIQIAQQIKDLKRKE